MTRDGFVRPMHTKSINRPRPRVGQIAVPDFVGILWQRNPADLSLALIIEQAQLHLRGMRREDREVDAETVPCGAERIRPAFLQPIGTLGFGSSNAGAALPHLNIHLKANQPGTPANA